MHAVSTKQISDILDLNDNIKYITIWFAYKN